MTAKLFTLPKQVPFTNSGALIPGAKAFFYLNGTSTPQDTYTTAALDVAHTNPVIADGNGRFPAIYMDASLSYKVKITDASDVEKYTEDAFNDVTAVAYPQTTAEASAGVTPTDYSKEPGNVLRYGATQGTGADSATAIQTAYDLSKTSGNPPCVIEGAYRIDSTLDFDATGGTPKVICRNATITKNFNGIGIDLSGGAAYNEMHGDLTITKMLNAGDGDGGGTPTAGDYGINQNSRFRQFGKIVIDSQQDDGYYIVADANLNGTYMEYVLSQGNNGKGFGGTGTTDNVAVWSGRWEAKGNYEAGVEFPDTFPARAWNFMFRCEDNAHDGTSDQCYTGGMNNSQLWVYVEESTVSTGVELHVPAASVQMFIFNSRVNTYTIASTTATMWQGGRYRSNNATPTIPGHVFEG